jgi:dUTP pyrophosphatase
MVKEFACYYYKMTTIRVSKLTDQAIIPTRGSERSAGWDLYAIEECIIPPVGKAIIKTDIAIAIPVGYYGRVAPRSGMAWKNHTDIGAGVIDSDYRGSIGVVIFNHGTKEIKVERGNRIAQLVIEQINTSALEEVPFSELDQTCRGTGSYGSTGV